MKTKTEATAQVVIDKRALAEIAALSIQHAPFDTAHLSHVEVQQVLVLTGLKHWLETFGVECPFELKVGSNEQQ